MASKLPGTRGYKPPKKASSSSSSSSPKGSGSFVDTSNLAGIARASGNYSSAKERAGLYSPSSGDRRDELSLAMKLANQKKNGPGSGGYYVTTPDPRPAAIAAAKKQAKQLQQDLKRLYGGAAHSIGRSKKNVDRFYNRSQKKGKQDYATLMAALNENYSSGISKETEELKRLGQDEALAQLVAKQSGEQNKLAGRTQLQGQNYDDLLQLLQGNQRNFVINTANNVRMKGVDQRNDVLRALQAQIAQIQAGPGGSRRYVGGGSGGGGRGGSSSSSSGGGSEFNKGYGLSADFIRNMFGANGTKVLTAFNNVQDSPEIRYAKGYLPDEQRAHLYTQELIRKFGAGSKGSANTIGQLLSQMQTGRK